MEFDCAKLTLAGNREENQDCVDIATIASSVLIIVVDGMGGHAAGAQASQLTIETVNRYFAALEHPVLDPQGFLTAALAQAHERVVDLGDGIALEQRPRATCAACLVQDGNAYWAHVGDSRMYHLRAGAVRHRSRDHSHVELLLREGLIGEHEAKSHPMRNFVECCLGGDRPLPDMSVTARKSLLPGDVLMACTDGLWTGVDDDRIASLSAADANLERELRTLAEDAVTSNSPHSDNTSAAALRWLGT